uniref:CCAAT-binding factor domain-containing protein n=1 Tax=Pseudonaja textilis TaxID=8673 RepID=A0A670ZD34_PSETE
MCVCVCVFCMHMKLSRALGRLCVACGDFAEDKEIILCAIRTCSRLFGALLTRGELFVGKLPPEEDSVQGNYSAEEKYKIWMRHRYNSCTTCLGELMAHEAFQVKEMALCTLMKFVELEAKHPLVKNEWSFNFPRELLQVVVEGLIQTDQNSSLLISRFQEYMEHDDVRFFVMKAVAENLGTVMPKAKQVTSTSWLRAELRFIYFFFEVRSSESIPLQPEHRRAFERMWLGFLKYKLPGSLYKKVLVILHDSILPHLNEPTLLMDFLTRRLGMLKNNISLISVLFLFCREYPDFYTKLYSLLDPSIFHVKYRARFFRLLDLFLSSSHLPAYLVAAFAKRLSRLALTTPPDGLLIVIPFICNLLRRHPSCLVLIHRPNGPMPDDPYKMDEKDPLESRAMESSLWEIKTLQNHYHPDVAKAAEEINLPLSQMEQDLSKILELTSFEIFDRDIKKESKDVPLEYQQPRGLFGKKDDLCAEYFSLE